MRRRGIRVIEIATVAAVLGILASLAIPSFLRIQARSRVQSLLESARSCRQELPAWLSTSLSLAPDASSSETVDDATREPKTPDPREVIEDYVRIFNERFQQGKLSGERPLLIVERTGTLPALCKRDGRIHIIPMADPAGQGVGAKVVVTDQDKLGGPNADGILAIYEVEPRTW